MRRILFDLLEINISMSVIILILCLISGKIRKKYGAEWMKIIWILVAVRLMIPYNLSLPFAEIRLLNYPGFAQEEGSWESITQTGNTPGEIGAADAAADEPTDPNIYEEGFYPEVENMGQLHASQNNITTIDGAENPHLTENEEMQNGPTGKVFPGGYQEENKDRAGEPYENRKDERKSDRLRDILGAQTKGNIFFYSDRLMRIWVFGMLGCVIYHASAYLYFYRKCRRSLRPVENKNLLRQIRALQRKLIGKNRILVYQSEMVASPMLVGILHPRLIIPSQKKQWTAAELEMVIAHELYHYRKKDIWLKLFMTVVCCVNWFNPVLLFMKKQFFYDMELACDGSVLSGCNKEERELYAKIMLFFAGNAKKTAVFSTGFREDKKRMKNRIDYMLDAGAKKKGALAMTVTGCIVLLMSLIVSCGYMQEGTEGSDTAYSAENRSMELAEQTNLTEADVLQDNGTQDGMAWTDMQADHETERIPVFDNNNDYNKLIRCYKDDIYIDREDGIYRVSARETEEELVYENPYALRRGMELYGNFLFFCGSAEVGEVDNAATVYRMNLDTMEVENVLDQFREIFYALYHISIYEDQLYVATGAGERLGFRLAENGEITGTIEEDEDGFLYQEYNDYMETQIQWMNSAYDSEEYWELAEELNKKYLPIMDVAACMKMLDGKQIVSRYKDELCRSIYLENMDGTYEYLCDATGYPWIATETGLYYAADERGSIWYVDYEEKEPIKIYELAGDEFSDYSASLANYDADYIYLLQGRNMGIDEEGGIILESYLVRIPRQGGEAEDLYRFEEYIGFGNLLMSCGVDSGSMYFIDHETISLDPQGNGMTQENEQEIQGAE